METISKDVKPCITSGDKDSKSMPTVEIDENGREILRYPSGMAKDKETGKFVDGPKTPEYNAVLRDPKGMVARRNELSKQIAREAIDEGAGLDPSKWGTGEGWRRVIVHTVQTFMKSSNIRGMAETFTKLGIAAGYLSNREEGGGEPPDNTISMTPETLRAVVAMLNDEIQERLEKDKAINV